VLNGRPGGAGVLTLEDERQFRTVTRRQGHQVDETFAVHVTIPAFHQDSTLELAGRLDQLSRRPQMKAQSVEYFYFLRNFHEHLRKEQRLLAELK
jgi:hypothetical protein